MNASEPTTSEIDRVRASLVVRHRSPKREASGAHVYADCPFCGHKDKLTFNLDTGLWDCLTGDTRIVTRSGAVPIASVVGRDVELLTDAGWQVAPVRSGGVRDVVDVTLVRDRVRRVVRSTPGHRWMLEGGCWTTTQDLTVGDHLASVVAPAVQVSDVRGIAAGIMFGDGNNQHVELWGPKRALVRFLRASSIVDLTPLESGVEGVRVNGQDPKHKSLPPIDAGDAFLLGWLQGYFATDGSAHGRCIDSASKEALDFARDVATRLGMPTSAVRRDWRKGFPGHEGWMYRLVFRRCGLWPEFFIRDDQREQWGDECGSGGDSRKRLRWRVESIAPGATEEVFCAVVDGRECFALEDNLLTGNCKHGECGEAGNLWKLADRVGIRLREKRLVRSVGSVLRVGLRKAGTKPPAATIATDAVDAACTRLFAEGDADGAAVRAYLHDRGIDDDAIRHFKLGVAYIKGSGSKLAVGIPYLGPRGCVLLKMRRIGEGDPRYMRTAGGESALFNSEGIRGRRLVVLVEGELDAVSLWQCGVTSVASTSTGAKSEMPQAWKEALADADTVVLWYDDDDAGQAVVESLCSEIGTHRVRLAEIPDDLADEVLNATGKRPKDCNDLVRAGVDPARIRTIVEQAKPVEVGAVQHVDSFRDHVASVINAGITGLGAETGLKALDDLIRGWRPQEVTYFTGHTGQGKSTFATACGEHYARNVGPVLMSSFEDGPQALAVRTFRRKFGKSVTALTTDEEKADAMESLPRLSEDPVYVIDHYGRVEWDDVADAIRFAARKLGVTWALIDHLHFIAKPRQYRDMHEWIEVLAQSIAALAVELNIHIAVIAHVNGAVEKTKIPTDDDIKNGSGIKQAAFNVVTVYRVVDMSGEAKSGDVTLKDSAGRRLKMALTPRDVVLYVCKKRHPDAREGMAVVEFDGGSSAYRDRAAAEDEQQQDVEPDLFGGTQ